MPETPTPKKSWLEVLASLTPLILGVLITGLGAFFTQVYNYRQLELTQLSALDKFRPLLTSEKPEEREFAYASFAALGYERLALRMIGIKGDGAGRAVAQAIQSTGDATAQAAATETLAKIPVQVFLHIGDEAQRAKAQTTSRALADAGFQPMGIENVAVKGGVVPSTSQVRFFNDADQATAETLANLLRQQGVADISARKIALKARPGTIEVWFSRNAP